MAYLDRQNKGLEKPVVVRNGYLPQRNLKTGIGNIPVKQPRVRYKSGATIAEQFQSEILPPYLRRTKNIEELIPWLYLKGVSTGDFVDALKALLGEGASGLSASTIVRLKEVWQKDYESWATRDLSNKRYVLG